MRAEQEPTRSLARLDSVYKPLATCRLLPEPRGGYTWVRGASMARIVICGGGAIGLLTALMLARREHEVTVVERDEPIDPDPADGSTRGWQVQAWRKPCTHIWSPPGSARYSSPNYPTSSD